MSTHRQDLGEYIQDVLISIHQNIRDLEEQGYLDGRMFSYIEMMAILRTSARDTGIDPKSIGL